jgi:hypothetical protein
MIEIDIDSYLDNFAKNNKKYDKNDLRSNQEQLAKALQYISVKLRNGKAYYGKLIDAYIELLSMCDIIPTRITKYTFERLKKELPDEIIEKIVLVDKKIKFKPETFGEMDYVDYVESILKDGCAEKYRYYSIIKNYHDSLEYQEVKEKYKIKNVQQLEGMLKGVEENNK